MHLLRWEFMNEDDTFKIHLEQHTTVTDYAILSHRWGKPEDETSPKLTGYDTSGLTPVAPTKVCYAFLNDVIIETRSLNQSPPASFSQSVWFIRGWTLQELIALQQVRFFDSRWSLIGCKTDNSLLPIIVSITNIDPIVLRVPATTKVISISKKMPWAAQRETTRKEDMAYCFMEVFGVFMSPLYGEGAHAFIRFKKLSRGLQMTTQSLLGHLHRQKL
ncbi:hypothetical protein FOXB_15816 [Fusarium oxysporum f. sp. conglutinans Fo5176]|uniref:Heterokaryon incompatibility domain-containing protein n=1 Tax=Fusarium oxysporum (strain Fo5176) TaxID=660025 RepID=F9GAY3_FUSOF|nr:hypothetical protein FOXB_15816 [Fusarium oxysporum f. sp. conglutinans Fo5176]